MAASKRPSALQSQPAGGESEEVTHWLLPIPSQAELASAFAQGLDLAEGQRPGHAARVCYIATSLAQALELKPERTATVYYAALLHDAGVPAAATEISRYVSASEEAIFGLEPDRPPKQIGNEVAPHDAAAVANLISAHPTGGADVARDLGLSEAVQEAIAAHHEQWDGHGYPNGLEAGDIPVTARIVAAADLIEFLVSVDGNPLISRRNFLRDLSDYVGNVLDREIARQAEALAFSDAFWLGLFSDDLPRTLPTSCPMTPDREEPTPADLHRYATVFAKLADARGDDTLHHSERTADLADRIATTIGFGESRREVLRIATLLHNVGLLGVPARVIAKPDILSLTEMETMRKHPTYSQMILETIPGLEDAARWVGAHHERPDGKGYPEMWDEEMIPLEAKIIAVADTYVALTSNRPYRGALSHEDAREVLLGGAGSQLDRKLVNVVCALPGPTSSRTARRSRRRR